MTFSLVLSHQLICTECYSVNFLLSSFLFTMGCGNWRTWMTSAIFKYVFEKVGGKEPSLFLHTPIMFSDHEHYFFFFFLRISGSPFKMFHLIFKDVHSCIFPPKVIGRSNSWYHLSPAFQFDGKLSDTGYNLNAFLLVRPVNGSCPRTLCLQFTLSASRWW